MPGYGMDGHVGFCFQQSGDASYTSSMDYAPIISETLTEEIEPIVAESTRGRYEEGEHYEGMHNIAGDVVMEAHPHVVGKLLRGFFGQSSGALSGNSATAHSFVGVLEDWDAKFAVPPMTVEVYRDTGSAFLYYGCCINALTFEWAAGGLTKVTAGIVGANFAWGAAGTPTYGVGSYFPWDTTSASFGGSAKDDITQLTLSLNQNLEGKHTLNGTKFASRVKRTGFRTAELSGSALFESAADALLFRAQTGQAVILTNVGEACAADANNTLKFDIPQFIFTGYPPNIGGPGLIEVGWAGKATYSAGSASNIKATLVNSVEVYA